MAAGPLHWPLTIGEGVALGGWLVTLLLAPMSALLPVGRGRVVVVKDIR